MKRLPERYYDLVLERDQLLEEEEYITSTEPVDVFELYTIKLQIMEIENELQMIERDMECDEGKKMYMIYREVYDIENNDFYSFYNEYSTIAEALVDFAMQVKDLKEVFPDYEELCETEDSFYVKDSEEIVHLSFHEVSVN